MLRLALCLLLISGPAAAELDYARLGVPVEVRGICFLVGDSEIATEKSAGAKSRSFDFAQDDMGDGG